MTRQRWSGKLDPLPWGWPVYCGFLFRGTKLWCTLRCCITFTIPCQATSPPTRHHASHLHSHFDFQPKQTANLQVVVVPFPSWQHTRAQHWPDWLIQIYRDTQRGRFRASREICMQSELSAEHRAWIHKEKKNDSVQDLSHPINQVILTHPVTCRRLAEQRRHLSGLDGTSNSGVMGKYTTPVSVINSVYCWNRHAVSNLKVGMSWTRSWRLMYKVFIYKYSENYIT